jgi:hypothetical protein
MPPVRQRTLSAAAGRPPGIGYGPRSHSAGPPVGSDFSSMLWGNMLMNVRDAFYDILRTHGITTIFGNPGSNELPLLSDPPG